MTAKGTKYKYTVRIEPETLPSIQDLSARLGFFVTTPGRYYGDPSPGNLLDIMAEMYKRDPASLTAALRSVGVAARNG